MNDLKIEDEINVSGATGLGGNNTKSLTCPIGQCVTVNVSVGGGEPATCDSL